MRLGSEVGSAASLQQREGDIRYAIYRSTDAEDLRHARALFCKIPPEPGVEPLKRREGKQHSQWHHQYQHRPQSASVKGCGPFGRGGSHGGEQYPCDRARYKPESRHYLVGRRIVSDSGHGKRRPDDEAIQINHQRPDDIRHAEPNAIAEHLACCVPMRPCNFGERWVKTGAAGPVR